MNFKEAKNKLIQNIKFYFLLSKLKTKYWIINIFKRYVAKYSFIISSVIYFALIITISQKLIFLFPNDFLVHDGVKVFTATGTMFGGVLAIVFSLTTLLMQNAAYNSSAGFYDILAKDNVQSIVFWVIALLTIIFFSLAIVFTIPEQKIITLPLNFIAQITIIIIGSIFWILFFLYRRIYYRIKPKSNIVIIEKAIYKYLEKTKRIANEISNIHSNRTQKDESKQNVGKELAKAASFQNLKLNFDYISTRIDHLFDFHDKLFSLNEKKLSREVLSSIKRILLRYFKIRSDSSIIMPSSEFLWLGVSDSQSFLTPNLENFVSKGEAYMKNDDNVGITHIINILTELTVAATNIKYVRNLGHDNPIFMQCRGYLDQLIISAIKYENMEGMFQGVKAYEKISIVAISNNLEQELLSIFKILNKVSYYAIGKRIDIIWSEVIKVYSTILQSLVLSNVADLRIYLKSFFEHIQAIVLVVFSFVKDNALEDRYSLIDLSTPFQKATQLVNNIPKFVKDADKQSRNKWQTTFLNLVEELHRSLRHISENIKNADHILIDTFGKTIENIGCLMLELVQDKKWEKHQEELIKQVNWYLHQTSWIVHYAEKVEINLNFDSLVEAVSKIGMKALQVNQDKIADDAIEILSNLATDMFKKEKGPKYGYTEPRIMKRACYIGILALKLNKKDLIKKLKKILEDFQKLYEQKYFSNLPKGVEPTSPKRDIIQTEIMQLRNEIYKHRRERGFLERADDLLIELIENIDIDKFTFEMWQCYAAGSPLEKKLSQDSTK